MTVQPTAFQRMPHSAPATAAGRLALVGLATVILGAVHLKHRPASMCLLRETTGIPCPFCGGTTAAVNLGHGNFRGALAASPIALLLFGGWPLLEILKPPNIWHNRWVRWSLIISILVFSEIWQLARFGIISL